MKSSSKKSVHARTLTFLTASFLFLSLTGCSDTDDASPDLEETTDPKVLDTPEIPETSNTPEYVPASEEGPAQNVPEPQLPTVTTEATDEGARAALEYFWEAESYASVTGDSGPLATVSSKDCAFCEESIEGWPRNYEEGYWAVMDGEIEVDVTQVLTADDENETQKMAHVYFELTEPPTAFYNDAGVRMEGSFDSSASTRWLAELVYDATAQSWHVNWVGLEEDVVWDES